MTVVDENWMAWIIYGCSKMVHVPSSCLRKTFNGVYIWVEVSFWTSKVITIEVKLSINHQLFNFRYHICNISLGKVGKVHRGAESEWPSFKFYWQECTSYEPGLTNKCWSCSIEIDSSAVKRNHFSLLQVWIETSTKMYTPFYIGFSLQYGPYAHFGYWTLVSDPW